MKGRRNMSNIFNQDILVAEVRKTALACMQDISEEIKVLILKNFEDEELLTKKELCDRILKCSVTTADMHYFNDPTFPCIEINKYKRYPKKAVEKWIDKKSRRAG